MKNPYIIAGVIIIVVILSFVFSKNKTEAPAQTIEDTSLPTSFSLADGSYRIDTDSSVIKWKSEFVTGKAEDGTLMLKSGSIAVAEGAVKSGNFMIDMNTIKDSGGKQPLGDHLKSDDFFSVKIYPEGSFVLKTVMPSSPEGAQVGRYIIGGNLTIKGIEKPISFPATITSLVDGSIKAESSFAINRAEWEIKYNSQSFFSGLGNKVIRDAVEITLDLKAVKE